MGKERRTLIGPYGVLPEQAAPDPGTTLRFTGPVPADARQRTPSVRNYVTRQTRDWPDSVWRFKINKWTSPRKAGIMPRVSTRFSLSMEMSRLTRDGTAELVSRDQIFRREGGHGNIHVPCSADHEQDWRPYPVDPYLLYVMTIYIHKYITHCSCLVQSSTLVYTKPGKKGHSCPVQQNSRTAEQQKRQERRKRRTGLRLHLG